MPPYQGFNARRAVQIPHLTRRAQRTAISVTGTVLFVLLGVALLFVLVVTLLICKNKVRKRRNMALQNKKQQNPSTINHNYQKLENLESRVQELSSEGQVNDPVPYRNVELQGEGEFRNQEPQEVDGFVAAPALNRPPVELPIETHTR